MRLPKRPGKLLASALLAAAVLGAAPDALRAQAGTDTLAAVRFPESPSEAIAAAQRQRARQARYHQRMAQADAHARMPDTMYASTPDPATPPHSFPLDVHLPGTAARSGPPEATAVRSALRQTHRIGLFPSAADALGRQGFARIINRSDSDGEVDIVAWDDAGTSYGPVTLAIGGGETKHFNSDDLEEGNAEKGLDGATGPPGKGHWRLELSSPLELQVLSYIRTGDGFLTSMHDVVARTGAGQYRVAIFNPGRNDKQVSRLRLVNPGAERTEVRIEGIDDEGQSPGEAVVLSLDGGASHTLSAKELESGTGVSGMLGTGKGKWQLVVNADAPIEVLNTLSTPTGHLTNLSTVPGYVESGDDGATTTHRIGLFPPAADALGRQGFARIINHSDSDGEVDIVAWDDAGTSYGPVTLAIGGGETKHFNSDDLEEGNAEKGLDGATGPPGKGNWRLELSSTLELQVLSYIRTGDGFLTSMHDVVARTGAGQHRVAIFNPGRNDRQVSRLRLVHPGAERTEVRIEGIDDEGQSPGEAVVLSLDGGTSRTLSAKELESGTGVSGMLGTGKGKWQLVVSADAPIEVLNTLSTPTGHLTNLSTVPVETESAAEVFREHISGAIVQGKCIACHVEGGMSGNTRLVFVPSSVPDHETRNLEVFEDFLDEVDDGARYILNKIQGVAHGGGVQVPAGSDDYENMERFLRLLGEDVTSAPLTPQTLFDTVTMAPVRKTLRRAALIFAGRIPTEDEYAAAQTGAEALRTTIRGLMTGPEFHEFLIRGANDRLLTDRNLGDVIGSLSGPFVDFIKEYYRRVVEARDSGQTIQVAYDWNDRVQHGARRAPLELIAHVVENDMPYTEILTADYIMANPWSAAAYGASTRFDDPVDVHEFKPSRFVTYYREGDGYESEYDPALGATRVSNPGPLITDYPHAGILNTTAFLRRYPTTATNRNRARSRWTYYHFLGHDIEKSASRTTDPEALADTNNPTLRNPACTVCHRVLDPVAGTFQNYGDDGEYKDQWGGLDSLDGFYKEAVGEERAIRAESWKDRETLSWSVGLAAGVETLRVVFTNNFYDEDTGDDRMIYLDRMRVVDARGFALVSHEFEDLGPPIAPWGPCGEKRRNPVTMSEDHIVMWNGHLSCALYIDIDIPSNAVYSIQIVAWADRYEQYGEDGFAKLSVVANKYVYHEGDTWYRDMRSPGFGGAVSPNSDNSAQWLAKQIVADERFAEATVKFWWPAIMGNEVTEPPEDEDDLEFEGLLLAANAQGTEVTRLANGFRRGFRGGPAYNLKDLLVEIVLSKWFRADAVEDAHPVRQIALRDAGARRLLTPEELAHKTAAITGIQWRRRIGHSCPHKFCDDPRPHALTYGYRLLYGGIDSDGIIERARDVTSVMAGVARRHAAVVSCPVVMRELYLLPESEQRLFVGIDRYITDSDAIRNKLVELHDKLLGVQVTPHSQDVESAYRLFIDVMTRGRYAREVSFRDSDCYWNWHDDLFFLEGILDDAVEWHENEHGGYYGFSDHANDFMNSVDWSDPHYAAQAWAVVLAYLLTDYRYLYL